MSYANYIHFFPCCIVFPLFHHYFQKKKKKNKICCCYFFPLGLHWLNLFSQYLISIHIKSNLTCFIRIRYVGSHLNNLNNKNQIKSIVAKCYYYYYYYFFVTSQILIIEFCTNQILYFIIFSFTSDNYLSANITYHIC